MDCNPALLLPWLSFRHGEMKYLYLFIRKNNLKLSCPEMIAQGGCEPPRSLLLPAHFPWICPSMRWVRRRLREKAKIQGPFALDRISLNYVEERTRIKWGFLGLGRSRYGKRRKINCPLVLLEASLSLSIRKSQAQWVVRHDDGTKSNPWNSSRLVPWFENSIQAKTRTAGQNVILRN